MDHIRLLDELLDVEYYRDLETWVKCHSRSLKLVPFESLGAVSLKMAPFDRPYAILYWSAIENISYTIFELFDVE